MYSYSGSCGWCEGRTSHPALAVVDELRQLRLVALEEEGGDLVAVAAADEVAIVGGVN